MKKIKSFLQRHPFLVVVSLILLVVLFIVIGNLIRKPQTESVAEQEPKKIAVYRVGKTPAIIVNGTVEKSGVITLTALVGGVISRINTTEGKLISRGNTILSIASNFNGGSTASVQRQIAEKNAQGAGDSLRIQTEIIGKQRDLSQQNFDNFTKQQDITNKSIDETKSVISINDAIITQLNKDFETASAANNTTDMQTARKSLSQYIGTNNTLKASLRQYEYSTNDDNPPYKTSELQKETTLKQLELQETSIKLQKELSDLQVTLARVQEAAFYPAAPFSGTIERIFVKVGQTITPGTKLATVVQRKEDDPIVVRVFVPQSVAEKLSTESEVKVKIGNAWVSLLPSFVSSDAVEGTLYGVYIPIPDKYNGKLTEGGIVQVSLQLGQPDTSSLISFIPIDAVYQSGTRAYVLVEKNNVAATKEILLGEVNGSYVRVEKGLENGDAIILNRTIIAGEKVSVAN